MAEQAQVIDIVEPMSERVSKAGKPYLAMKVAVKKSDNAIETMMSFDEYKVGEIVSIDKNDKGYWGIVKPSRGYDKPLGTPAAGAGGTTDVMQSLRFIYKKLEAVESKIDAIIKEGKIPHVEKTDAEALQEFFGGATPPLPEPQDGFAKFQQKRATLPGGPVDLGDIPLPDEEIKDEPLDLSDIPF